mmetsp:Transcript_76238/g.151139  ORF Transcript_76238/g.151139 Transcript_76238/m.151139 type:complete len:123 (-) Transcript_76238:112-480(-)
MVWQDSITANHHLAQDWTRLRLGIQVWHLGPGICGTICCTLTSLEWQTYPAFTVHWSPSLLCPSRAILKAAKEAIEGDQRRAVVALKMSVVEIMEMRATTWGGIPVVALTKMGFETVPLRKM